MSKQQKPHYRILFPRTDGLGGDTNITHWVVAADPIAFGIINFGSSHYAFLSRWQKSRGLFQTS